MEIDSKAPLTNQHAVITGGGRGIGAAIAAALARSGASVSLIGRNQAVLDGTANRVRASYGVKVATASADVTDEAAVRNAVSSVSQVLGAPSILVNNAGVGLSSPFLKSDAAFWRKILDVDLMGAVFCTRAVLPAMVESRWGRIVNIASTAGMTGYAYITAYCAAKHAVIGFTRALAMETARTGVTVNAICPAYVDTDMTAETIANIVQKTGRSREEAVGSLIARNPQGRLIQPAEVADAVVWLSKRDAASITGQSIIIAGGELMP
ncbi:MAG TPA: SDR family NAD(P)-dependent oxidoreductase [Candidatus Dormibacteraeota bacterium]|nr:SDR family NAD(P)-dependent oxidoreductase [Candidatus Dormibacteraeota bacterium]